MNKLKINNKGLSLLELILSIFLLSILSLGIIILFNLYKDYQSITPISISRSIIKKSHSESLSILKQNILEAQNILSSTTINGQTYTTDNKTLILQLRSIDNNQNIIIGNYDLVLFYVSSTNPFILFQKIIPSAYSARKNTNAVINNMVKNINFEYNTPEPKDANLIKISLETSNNFSGKEITESSYITIKLNK
ncbi:MAG: prepilin-type N-terminal cleavage/methylation domain-containing protein [Minisyncoccia bacterium]